MDARNRRRPGESAFAGVLFLFSIFLFYQAYQISGFEALSSPGALPLAASGIMVVSSGLIFIAAVQAKVQDEFLFWEDILPPVILIVIGFILAFAFMLQPLGFIPSAFIFLSVSIFVLRRKGLFYSLLISAVCLVIIYVLFRLVFSVLMPEGIVPERELIAVFENLFSGGGE